MCDEISGLADDSLRLPKGWRSSVRNAVLNVIGVVRIAMLTGREVLIANGDAKDARIHQLESEVAMLREELRINGARMNCVPSHRRPQYTAIERMAILQLRAMRGWNKAETARHFFVTDDTIRSWLRRVDDDSLVQTKTPVNRFPDFVRYAIQQIKLFCPTLGKVKIADMLARAGIHIGKTTVGRILKENPVKRPDPTTDDRGQAVQHRLEVPRPHVARRSDGGAHFRRLLDQLDSQRHLPTMARVLVGSQCDRSLLTTVHGSRRVQVSTDIGGSDRRFGSHHGCRESESQTLDC